MKHEKYLTEHCASLNRNYTRIFQIFGNKDLHRVPEDAKIVDVGCAHARNAWPCLMYYGGEDLSENKASYLGLDLDSGKLLHAETLFEGISNINFRNADATSLSEIVETADVVTVFNPDVGTNPHWYKIFEEIHKVMHDDGLLLVGTYNAVEMNTVFDLVSDTDFSIKCFESFQIDDFLTITHNLLSKYVLVAKKF